MATIKAYTDLSQSKKLAEILPLESADMNYWCGTQIRIGGISGRRWRRGTSVLPAGAG